MSVTTRPTVTLTERAAGEIQRVMNEQQMGENMCVRIGVKGGGCSGFDYDFHFEEKPEQTNDLASEQHGVLVLVDRRSELYLEGTTIDFYEGLEKRGFTFTNPNAVKTCGCGNSFSV